MKFFKDILILFLVVIYGVFAVGGAQPCLCAPVALDLPAGCCCAQMACCDTGDCCCGCQWEASEESTTRVQLHVAAENEKFQAPYTTIAAVLPGEGLLLPDASQRTAVFFKRYIPPDTENGFLQALSHRGPPVQA